MDKKIPDNNYFTIHSFMINELELTGLELFVYAIIYSFSQDGKSWYCGGNGYIENWTGKTKKTVITIIKSLCEKGLVEKKSECKKVNEKIKTSVKHRATYKNLNIENNFSRITSKQIKENTSVEDITTFQVAKICNQNQYSKDFLDFSLLFIKKYYDFFDYYLGEKQDFLSEKTLNNLLNNIMDIYQCITEEDIEKILDFYIDDNERFLSIGISPSINHLTSSGIINIYLERIK